MARLWDKGGPVDDLVLRFTVGDDPSLDARLVPYDVRASQAHVRMLAACGHLGLDEAGALVAGLAEAGEGFARGEWSISVEDEDGHTALENRLVATLGELGGKVHLGRSRNDQVLVALRLYLKDRVAAVQAGVEACAGALDEVAELHPDVPMPGYTHMQRAMPSSVGLWASGWAANLREDRVALEAAGVLADSCPLGSAAGYGTPGLRLDREATASDLGFGSVQEPVTAVQTSRGKAEAAFVFGGALVLQDLGRVAADLCLFATAEFGFVRLPEAFTTGSSIMPQKRNPDVFELVRGHSAAAVGDLVAVLGLTGKATSGYHRDLQLLKGALFRAVDRVEACLEVMARALPEIRFDAERCAAAMDPGLFAAERAFALVQAEGLSFREAYRRVASELD